MPVSDAPTSPRGRLGQSSHAAFLVDALEHVPDLQWPDSVRTYARMRHDPTIRSVLAAYTLPIRRAPWHVDPRGASPTIVRIVADSLGMPVLGGPKPDDGPVASKWVRWEDHLRLSLLDLVFGHMPFEPIYDVSTGVAFLADLPERMPWTITKIATDDRGRLTGIKQTAERGPDVEVSADRLLWYAHEREGAAWHGQSLLRPCYGPWLFKQDSMRGQATTLRRFGAATPVMEPLPGTNPTQAQIVEAARLAQNVRVGDSGGAATPGFTLRLKGIEGAVPDHMPFLRYLDEQIARAALTSVLDLGSTQNGSRALGNVFADMLVTALQATAEAHAVTASQLARRLTDFNEGADAPAPIIVVGDVGSSPRVLAETIAGLVDAGALQMDDALEAWVRDAFGLPERTRPRTTPPVAVPVPSPAGQGAEGEADEQGERVAAANITRGIARQDTAWPYRRQLTAIEAKAALDPLALDEVHARLVGDLLRVWPAIQAAQVDALVQAVEDAVQAGSTTDLATVAAPYGDAAAELLAALVDAYDVGAAAAREEAARQGVTVDPPAVEDEEDGLSAAATITASAMATSLAGTAMREAVRRLGPDATARDVADGVRGHLESLTGAYTRDVLGGLVTGGMNRGRAAVFRRAPQATYYASEVRDANTCPRCSDVDGRAFTSLEDAEAAYANGGYVDCDGGLRCRGVIVAVWDTGEQEAA